MQSESSDGRNADWPITVELNHKGSRAPRSKARRSRVIGNQTVSEVQGVKFGERSLH